MASPAQIAANQKNAARSSGPKTEDGKTRSRANSLKHGLTGEGIVIPEEDRAEVELRVDEFEADYRPRTGTGRFLIRRAAMLSVRLDRAVQQEFAVVAQNVREAPGLFDEARRLEVDRLMKALVDDPADSVRQLRQSPEGIDALLGAIHSIRANLLGTGDRDWDGHQGFRLQQLLGRKPDLGDRSRVATLCHGVYGNFSRFKPEEGPGLSDPDRKAWARQQLTDLIDREIASLLDDRNKIDFASIARDRAESADRALFDPSREAERARKYEAASERTFFRTLKEYREVESEIVEPDVTPDSEETSEELGSFCPESPVGTHSVSRTPRSMPVESVRGSVEDHEHVQLSASVAAMTSVRT